MGGEIIEVGQQKLIFCFTDGVIWNYQEGCWKFASCSGTSTVDILKGQCDHLYNRGCIMASWLIHDEQAELPSWLYDKIQTVNQPYPHYIGRWNVTSQAKVLSYQKIWKIGAPSSSGPLPRRRGFWGRASRACSLPGRSGQDNIQWCQEQSKALSVIRIFAFYQIFIGVTSPTKKDQRLKG